MNPRGLLIFQSLPLIPPTITQYHFDIIGCHRLHHTTKETLVKSYSPVNWVELDGYLLDVDLGSTTASNDANVRCDFLQRGLAEACSNFIPEVQTPPNPSPVWFNSEIRHCLNRIHSLWKYIDQLGLN